LKLFKNLGTRGCFDLENTKEPEGVNKTLEPQIIDKKNSVGLPVPGFFGKNLCRILELGLSSRTGWNETQVENDKFWNWVE
jgi:hypothetical protein